MFDVALMYRDSMSSPSTYPHEVKQAADLESLPVVISELLDIVEVDDQPPYQWAIVVGETYDE